MTEVSMLIGGKDRLASNGATFERLNPATGKLASRAPAATLADADAAVDAAAAAFPAWSALPPTERRMRLLRAADLMDARTSAFIETGVAETGAMANWYGFNVHLAANMLREAAAMTTQIDGSIVPTDMPGNLALAVRQPCGVVLGIAPWNAPVILGTRAVAMPLACGNTVVLKASEACPAVHRMIGSVLQEAGLGDGVINVVTNAPDDAPAIVERLIAHLAVRRVNFTGSTHVGRIIAMHAAKHLKPALLELGGKAPVLVLDDADLDAAVEAIAFGAFFNQGQICMSTERVIAHRAIADTLVEKLVSKARKLVAAEPTARGAVLGAMVSAQAAQRATSLVQDARDHGATIHTAGPTDGAIMQPTIVDGVRPEMKLYSEESFAPVVTVLRVDSDDEAIRVANDSEFGLSAAVFSRDIARAMQVAKRVESGICHINGPTVHDEAQMPFGGVKSSGYGRFGSKASIAEFTDLRWITIQTGPRHYPI
ncbi:aldehyde dehydrogenase [Paraburkholderia sabiae]|uniref:Aldehyde dehydrogenase n=1 Tax=Paraburkholderia sabiae TaxID=273251 RepID=A0ABU9QB93_9BURK|nr:aldehyde dehydrogenase [Paraburkholderia sabiae]WJZ72329.1 aldehyde dehydrogenase [Paraburkholderia sabiae]CAD6537731.1 Vanillin dehydrogenase [Paraburkholderia sabiae]